MTENIAVGGNEDVSCSCDGEVVKNGLRGPELPNGPGVPAVSVFPDGPKVPALPDLPKAFVWPDRYKRPALPNGPGVPAFPVREPRRGNISESP